MCFLSLYRQFSYSYLVKLNILLYSASDDRCHHTLLSIIETVPMKVYVDRIVSRLLATRMKISEGKINVISSESGLFFFAQFFYTSNILLLEQSTCRLLYASSWMSFTNIVLESYVIWPVLSGSQDKQILISICEKYPNESQGAFYSFLKVGSSHFLSLVSCDKWY